MTACSLPRDDEPHDLPENRDPQDNAGNDREDNGDKKGQFKNQEKQRKQ